MLRYATILKTIGCGTVAPVVEVCADAPGPARPGGSYVITSWSAMFWHILQLAQLRREHSRLLSTVHAFTGAYEYARLILAQHDARPDTQAMYADRASTQIHIKSSPPFARDKQSINIIVPNMFYIVPSTQAPHNISPRASFPSYPSEDFARPHSHHHHRHHHRSAQPGTPYIGADSLPSSDLYASQQRYNQALAHVRAAEAEYLRAQARARAEEQARFERQRVLQAAARQRAYEEELARMERARVLQTKAEAERQRRVRIELLRRQMFATPAIEATTFQHSGYPHRQHSELQQPRPRQDRDAMKDVFEFLYGATAERNPTPAPTKRVSFAATPSYSSSVPPTPAPQTPLKPRPSAHPAKPQSDEDAITDFITSLFGAPVEAPKKAAVPAQPDVQATKSQPSSSASPADDQDIAKFISTLFGVPVHISQKATPAKSTPAPDPTPAPARATAETKPISTPVEAKETVSDQDDFLNILSGLFGLGAFPQRQPSAPQTVKPTPQATPQAHSTPGIVIRDDPPKDVKGKGKARDPSPSPSPSPASIPSSTSTPTAPVTQNSLSSLLENLSSAGGATTHGVATRLQEELLSGKLDREMEEVVTNVLASLVGGLGDRQQQTEMTAAAEGSGASGSGNASRSSSPGASGSGTKSTESPRPPPITISVNPVNADSTSTSIPEPPSPAESTHSNHSTLSIHSIDKIESSFHALRSSFVFPPSLDFSTSEEGAQGDLAFTPTNAPLRAYEHALNGLLAQLDGVESEGDESVRGRRREVVREVEKELERVEGKVGEMKKEVAGVEVKEDVAKTVEEAGEDVKVELAKLKDDEVQKTVEEVQPATVEVALDAETTPTPAIEVPTESTIAIEAPSTSELEPQPSKTASDFVDTSGSAATATPPVPAPLVEDVVTQPPAIATSPTVIASEEPLSHVEPSPASTEAEPTRAISSSYSSNSPPLEPLALTDLASSVDSEPSPPSDSVIPGVHHDEPADSEPSSPQQTTEVEAEQTTDSPKSPDLTPEFLSSFTKDQFSFPPRRSFTTEESQSESVKPAEADEDVVVVEGTETVTSEVESESSVSVSVDGSEWSEVDA